MTPLPTPIEKPNLHPRIDAIIQQHCQLYAGSAITDAWKVHKLMLLMSTPYGIIGMYNSAPARYSHDDN